MVDPRAVALLNWYDEHARDLPWRRTRDPYSVLVSEVMSQQTQISRVIPAYSSFLARFPDVEALADATVADVVTAWRGLGYNRRAVNLHRTARAVVDHHGGVIPDDLDTLRSLPGIGEYTARAVLTFAYGQPHTPVDTNVSRVVRRAFAGEPLRGRQLQAYADGLLARGRPRMRPGAWGQALMELGARHCTARAPRCDGCPLLAGCAWRGAPGRRDPAGPGESARARPVGRFEDSDRFHRGRLVDALRAGAVPRTRLAAAASLADKTRAARLADALVADGLASWDGDALRLPGV